MEVLYHSPVFVHIQLHSVLDDFRHILRTFLPAVAGLGFLDQAGSRIVNKWIYPIDKGYVLIDTG